jgi:hypothetical protein
LCLVSFSYLAVQGINHVIRSDKVPLEDAGKSLGILR